MKHEALLVPRELSKPGERHIQHGPVPTRASLEENTEVEVVTPRWERLVAERLDHLPHFESDEWMIRLPVCVVLGEERACFFVSVFGDKPSGRLRIE